MQRSRFLLPVLLACASLTVMAGATISPGLPGLYDHFQDYPNAEYLTRFILTVPGLSIALCAPIAGILADKLGRRFLLYCGIALYILSGSAGLWLDDLQYLLISRFFLGVAVGIIMVCSTALVTDHFQGAERERAMGMQSSAMAAGGIVFISIGSILADVSWRAPFLVYLAPIVLFPLVLKYVTKPPQSMGNTEAAHTHFPFLHAAMIYWLGFLTMLLFYFIPTQLPFLAIELGASSLKHAGFAVVVSQVFSAIASANYARVRRYFHQVHILLGSFLCIVLGYLLLSQSTSLFGMFISMPILGIGLGLNFPNLTIWLMSRIPSGMRGRASGGLTTAVFLGQFLSPLLSQPMVLADGLAHAYFVAAMLSVLLVIIPASLWVLKQIMSSKN